MSSLRKAPKSLAARETPEVREAGNVGVGELLRAPMTAAGGEGRGATSGVRLGIVVEHPTMAGQAGGGGVVGWWGGGGGVERGELFDQPGLLVWPVTWAQQAPCLVSV